jgi:hypothetical protein
MTFRSLAVHAEFTFIGKTCIKLSETSAMTAAGAVFYINPNEVIG